MSELFISHLICYIAAIVMLTIALKLSYYKLIRKGILKRSLVSIIHGVDNREYISDSEDHKESIRRMDTCCNYVILVGILVFILVYFSYAFNLFETIPVNPLKY